MRRLPVPAGPTLPMGPTSWILAFGFALSLSGCGRETVAPQSLVPLALRATRVGATSLKAPTPATGTVTGAVSATEVEVTFTRALLVLRDVRFKWDDGVADGDTVDTTEDGGLLASLSDGDSLEPDVEGEGMAIFRGPFVVDLLSAESTGLDTVLVQPGEYRRVQGHLRALRDTDAAATEDLAFLVGSTVHLEGTIEGDPAIEGSGGPFLWSARIDDEFQIRGRFQVESETPATAFLTFDLSRWLLDRQGNFLDPRVDQNAAAIRSAIRHSIKIWMDDDHDGALASQDLPGGN